MQIAIYMNKTSTITENTNLNSLVLVQSKRIQLKADTMAWHINAVTWQQQTKSAVIQFSKTSSSIALQVKYLDSKLATIQMQTSDKYTCQKFWQNIAKSVRQNVGNKCCTRQNIVLC